eukprot:12425148-Karenia_brevis.AAC.1
MHTAPRVSPSMVQSVDVRNLCLWLLGGEIRDPFRDCTATLGRFLQFLARMGEDIEKSAL